MVNLIDKVRNTIENEAMIDKGDRIILALSGGPDSVCLCHILWDLSSEIGFALNAVHINHMLRDEAADADCNYVKELCEKTGIPLDIFEIDVKKLASENGVTVEEAGRIARYDSFDSVARKIEIEEGFLQEKIKIATAHTKSDQVETLLMRIIRGTGPSGLAGIPYSRVSPEGYTIVRPLLDAQREEIEEYCSSKDLSPRIDASNDDVKYFRNKIRHHLIPFLTEEFGDSVIDSVYRLSSNAKEDKDFFSTLIEETIDADCDFIESTNGEITCAVLPLALMRGVHPSIRRRLITSVFSEIGLNQDISAVHHIAADELLDKAETGKSIDFPGGYKLEISYENVIFRDKDAPFSAKDTLSGARDSAKDTLSGAKGIGKENSTMRNSSSQEDVLTAEFDEDALNESGLKPEWRTRLPGDRIRPEGMTGSKKLQDLFVDLKIPRSARDNLRILAIGDNILWIPGIRKSRDFAVTDKTNKVIIFKSKQNTDE